MNKINEIMTHYDSDVQKEWERLDIHYFEWAITLCFMERYIQPGDRILDVSGGPGKYSIYFAKKGCDVTLVDLSAKNIEFANAKAEEEGVHITALQGDACCVDTIVSGQYDHVFLMGALYHLQAEKERVRAVTSCMKLLKPNGIFYASFISNVAGILYALRDELDYGYLHPDGEDGKYLNCFISDKDFTGMAFTHSYFISPQNVLPFFKQFLLKKLHYFGQEGILPQAERELLEQQPQQVIDWWVDFAVKTCEREDLLSHSEHLMYIGRKV